VSFDLRALKIYVDGSCLRNPGGTGGIAARLEFPYDWNRADELLDLVGFFETSNNRMELRACIFAHEWLLNQQGTLEVQHVQIVTDSKYVFENYHRCIYWSKNGWLNVNERPIENVDLWKQLLRVRRKLGHGFRVEMKLTLGKSTPVTKEVDRDAKTAARRPDRHDTGYRPGKVGRSINNPGKAAAIFPASGGELVVRVYQTSVVNRRTQKIKFQTFSEQNRDFFDKYFAYAESNVGNSLHRQHIYRVRMNSLPKNPRIEEILEDVSECYPHPVVSSG
jgi:ribonuclease HI